ncbi:MAG TPA: hypothetical protein PLP73_00275 [Candidatus Absconditabacterales bacterium]|nr:hypothetical protein [Candidatus Absconditabacterales bacterium]HRU50024.1 hypothetical protein [Candidatus Absconditabacterales bacterium]
MAKIIDELTKANGRGIHHFRYGYEEAPIVAMLFYDLTSLNNSDLDFKGAKVKHAKMEKTKFANATKITWYEDNIKESSFTATGTTAGTTLDVSISTLQVGDQLRNKNTGDIMLVVDVPTPGQVTVDVNTSGVTTGDEFIRFGFAKTYGEYSARSTEFNDYVPYDNYVQFVSAEIDQEKTDILTNNLDRLFYATTKDYLKELYAEASRVIIRTIVYSLYAGRSQVYTLPSGKKIYTAGGLEYYIPLSALDQNIKGANSKETIANLQDQVVKAYKSGVSGLTKANRLMLFANYGLSAQITSDFLEISNITINDNTMLEKYGINMKSLNLNGYKINIVEDPILDELYGEAKTGFIVDIDGIVLYNLAEGVIGTDGKTTDALGASVIFCPPQVTYELRTVSLNTHFTWLFKNISSGCFRKIIYV